MVASGLPLLNCNLCRFRDFSYDKSYEVIEFIDLKRWRNLTEGLCQRSHHSGRRPSVCVNLVPRVCFADTVSNRFSEGLESEGRFELNYGSSTIAINITSGTTTERFSGGRYIDCRVYDQYINVTERDYKWYIPWTSQEK